MSLLPASGGVAGVYAAVDRTRGVWKAPANVSLADVVGPAVKLNDELGAYAPELLERPQIVVLSKIDLVDDPQTLLAELQEVAGSAFPLCAPTREGVDVLVKKIAHTLASED